MGFVEIQIALLVPCRRARMYINGQYLPSFPWDNPKNQMVNPNPSLYLACMVLMTWPHLTHSPFINDAPAQLFFILFLKFHLLFPTSRLCPCPPPWPRMLSFLWTYSLSQGKPVWGTLPEGGSTSIHSVSRPTSYLFPSQHLPWFEIIELIVYCLFLCISHPPRR